VFSLVRGLPVRCAVTNPLGAVPVGRVDDMTMPTGTELMKTVQQVYESVPWDPI
jgi:hypothetical protein